MSSLDFLSHLRDEKIEYCENEPMSARTTFKIGGAADIIVSVGDLNELRYVLLKAKQLKFSVFVLGKGSNILVSDKGIGGVVVSLSKMSRISVSGETITAEAGASLANVCKQALASGLSGLEFAYGIPGSVGGATYMNAGAYGRELCDVIESVFCVDQNGNELKFAASEASFGYRESIFKEKSYVITRAVFKLKSDSKEKISSRMEDYISRRKQKQPLEWPSAGSTFKRPEGNFAGALIEQNGLKGLTIGNAQVSEKHAGFIINKGAATAQEVRELIKKIQDIVLEKNGVLLEPEVIFVGRE